MEMLFSGWPEIYPILPEPFKIVEACYVDYDSECHLIAGDSERWPFKDC